MLIKLYGRHLLMKLNYNATHFECFSSTFHYATCFLPIPQSRLAGYDGRADSIISIPGFYFVPSLTLAHGQRMSHRSDLFNVGHGSENGKRQPHKKNNTWQLLTDVKKIRKKNDALHNINFSLGII